MYKYFLLVTEVKFKDAVIITIRVIRGRVCAERFSMTHGVKCPCYRKQSVVCFSPFNTEARPALWQELSSASCWRSVSVNQRSVNPNSARFDHFLRPSSTSCGDFKHFVPLQTVQRSNTVIRVTLEIF